MGGLAKSHGQAIVHNHNCMPVRSVCFEMMVLEALHI